MNDKVLSLYKTMKSAGADVGTEQEFNDYFFARGDQGYKNRLEVYNTFKSAGADVGKNYEEFRDWLNLKAVKPGQPNSRIGIDTNNKTKYQQTINSALGTVAQARQTSKPWGARQMRTTEPSNGVSDRAPFRKDLTVAERAEIERNNNYAARQVDKFREGRKREDARRNTPIATTGNKSADRYVVKTQGQYEDEVERGIHDLGSRYVSPVVQKAMQDMDDQWYGTMGEAGSAPMGEGGEIAALRRANESIDPDKVLEGLRQRLGSIYSNPDMQRDIEEKARKAGIPRDEYVSRFVEPAMKEQLESDFSSSMIARNLPKNATEYIIQGLGDSIGGMLMGATVETKGQRAYRNQADAMTEEGGNPYYNPGKGARLTKMGVSFAADAPFFGVYGKVSGSVVKNIAERQIKNMMAKGLSEGAARSIVGTALENSVGARMKNYLMQHVVSSSLTMGAYNATSETARQLRDKEGIDIGSIAASTGEGLATGAAFGVTGGVSQALSQPLSGIRKVGAKIAGFGAEAETMYATEELAKMAHGEEGFTDPFEGGLEAVEKLGVMKLSSGHLLESTGKRVLRAKEAGVRQAAIETLADFLGKNRSGVEFSRDEEAYVRNSAEGKSLLEALSGMHPELAVSEVNGKKRLTKEGEQMRRALSESYNSFMENAEIPATVKQKVAGVLGGIYRPGLETGADILHNADGSVVVKTRDKNGNCIRDIKFDSFDEARQWQDSQKSQFSRNDAVDMWNNASVETRQKIVDAVRDEVSGKNALEGKRAEIEAQFAKATGLKQKRLQRQLAAIDRMNEEYRNLEDGYEGREMTDEEARNFIQTVIRDGSDEVFDGMYGLISDTVHPADEYNPQRRYQEGRRMSAEERHIAKADLQLQEERLLLIGEDFAKEVTDNADYADEKMAELAGRRDVSGEQLEAARDYYNAKARLDGALDETIKGVDEQVEEANATIRRNTHPGSGSLIEASHKGMNCYVTAGHFQVTADGRIEPTDDSGVVILRDKETGDISVVSPRDVLVTAINDPRRMIEANDSMDGLRGELMRQAEEGIELHPDTPDTPQSGDSFIGEDGQRYAVMEMQDDQGSPLWMKVAVDEGGNMTGEPQPLDLGEYRRAKSDEMDRAERPQTEQPPVEQDTPPAEEAAPLIDDLENRLQGTDTETAGNYAQNGGENIPEQGNNGVGNIPDSRIPVDDKGKKIYEQAKPEDTLSELTGKYGEEKARQFIAKMAENTARALDELSRKDTSKMTDANDLEAYNDELSELQKKADYWKGLIKPEETKVEKAMANNRPVLSDETNEYGKKFVVSGDGSTIFGEITQESGLTPAPIKLSEGEDSVDENGRHHGYGLLHIEASHGDQIRKAGYPSVQAFVEDVARNYDTIREGNAYGDSQSYLLEITDEKDNTVFIEMSRDGNYWNVNSAGIFRKSYSRNKKEVQSLPTIGSDANADTTGVNHGQSEGATVTSENSPSTSDGKDTKKNDTVQEKQQKNDVSRVEAESPHADVQHQQQTEAQRKVYEGSVRNNVGRTFEFTDKSGKRTEITITGLTADGQAEVRRRDFDAQGSPLGEERVQQFFASRIGEGIVNGTWKRTMTDGERLRDAYKGRMGMENLIETLGDDEASALWVAHERARTEDGEAAKADLREMINDLQHRHVEDIVDNGRARRVAEAEKALSGGRYADKLRKLRRAYQGIDGMDDILSDHALEPVTIEEYAAAYLGDVPKAGAGFIDHESLVAETGHGSRRIGGDSRAYSSYLAPKGKGRSIKQIAHEMWQDLSDRLHDEWTDQDCLNALVEVLTSGEKPSDVAGYILRNRQRQAEELARAQEDESLNAYFSGEIKFQKVVRERFRDRLDSAIADTDTEPTEAQKEAGNYRKGHISFGGYDLTIENPAGSIRRGTGSDGRPWEHQMQNTYGYILGKKGKDGDHLDMFINDDADLDSWNGNVYVVDQVDPKTGKFDEHKIMYGFDSEAEAREAYLSNYADGWKGLGRITGVSKETFDKWLESSERKIKEFSDHSIVKEAAGNKIQGLKGYTKADVLDAVRGDIDSILEENGIDSVEIKGMDLHGSRMRGDAREDSDLDVVVEYEGDISEDGLFNILNENPVTIEGIRVDINPITKGKSGTLEQYMERSRKYDDEKRKSSENGDDRDDGANRADKADKANKPNKPNRADKAAPIGSTSSQEQVSGQNHMVEGEPLSPVSEQETALRDAVVKHLRSLGVEVSTDWEEGQRILDEYNGNGPIKKMGTTTNNRMSDVATQFADKQLTDQQSVIASVYTGEKDNQTATFKREDGSAVRMKFQQGEDTKAGTKHSLFAHYGTTKGVISADDILRIPDAIEKGNRKQKGKNVEYTLKDGKTTYTVYAKVKGGIEVFQDFYSSWKIKNKETSASKPSITQGENTQSAQSDDANVSSGAKVQQNPETAKDSERKFFRTPDGHAYGYTYQGKIYIDPRIATAETPVHEYGHLWCEMKRDTAPEEWGKMKEVMLGDKKVQPIIERVKRDYPELAKEGREDDFIEEIITQFSGKRGAERLREIANEVAAENGGVFGKAEAVTAMQRLKNVLNRFWEGVARMMGWKYRTADQIADRMMADMLNGVNPRERMDGKPTSKMREQQEIERTLMGVHNISEEKLKKVLKQGGLANPSLAVIDTRNGMHTDFGDISLIPRSSLIDSKKGNNAGTYTGDAWTPTYPQVVRELSKKGEKSIGRIAKDAAGGNEELERHLLGNLRMFTEGNGSRLHLLYLLQKGKSPEILNKKTKHTHEEYEELMKLFPTGDYSTDGLTKEQNDGIMKLMLKEYEAEVDRRVANIKDEAGRAKVKDMLMKTKRESIADADGNLYFSKWNNYFYAVKTDENTRKNPQVDWYGTDLAADNRIAREGMSEDYAKWKEGLLGDEDMVEKLFAGFDRDGNRKYLPNTAENASRLMNRQGDTNAYNDGGLNATRASLLKKLGSLSEIRKHRELLQGKDAYDEKQKEMSDELFDIISQICDMQQISDNRFSNTDYAEARFQEAVTKRDPLGYLKKEYGYDISKDSELGRQIMNFIEEAGNLPVKYFETKFKRPVGLDEFAVAVVPETTSPEVVKALKDAGLDVRTYNNTGSLEQQNENRRQATMDAVQGRDDIMFQKKREAERVKTFHDAIDEMFSNPDFDKTAHSRDRYDLGDTPEFMKKVGITGDSFSLSFKNIKTHMGKDADHNLTAKEWHELPEAIKKPFLITTYGDKEGRYRLYTSIKVGNKFAVVGIDVVKTNQGKDKPILEVNRIKTVFGRDRYVMENGEKILAYDERMTPEQEALLRGHNFREYPSVQELSSVGKDTKNIDTIQENGQENADEAPKFQRVVSPEPELTPEDRQYWKKWEGAMKKWRERNGLPADAEAPAERPRYRQGESAMDYAKRVTGYMRERALWETAPKLEDYRQAREDKMVADEAREAEKAGPDLFRNNKALRAAADMARIRHAMARQKAYDKATVKAVTDFAQDFMRQGFGDNLGRGDIERLLSSVKNATGGRNVKKEIDNIQDILVDNFLRNLENSVVKLSSVKELRQTAQGVEKQGKLELKGQRMIQAFREARDGRLAAEQIRERMSDVLEKMSANDGEAPMREQEYEGLSIALRYVEGVDASRQEYASLKREYDDAVKGYKQSGRSYQAQQQLLESLDEAMQENKIERIGLYGEVIGRLQGNISESVKGAREFVEREKQRVKHIYSLVNFDLAGKDAKTSRREDRMDRVLKNDMLQLAFSPLATFEQMLKQFGTRNVNGEGYLYNYFMRNYIDSVNNAYTGTVKAREELDTKAKEIFGDKVKHWSDLYSITSKPGMDITYLDGEQEISEKLSQGNMLYIYMANKMSDGKMKLRKMGITEEDVDAIKEALDPRLVQLGDWLQGEYLPQKRTEYNKVHERMFGAPMAAIDNYFPIKVNRDAAWQDADKYITSEEGDKLPSSITGSIIKRTRNALPLDILHTDALSLAMEHLEDMEQWKAQAEFNRDVKDLLSYTTFRNKVKNMKTIYGSGTTLWNKFFDDATIATGDYNPKRGVADKTITNIAKGVTAAKINFRVYTAFKQILSAPAFLHDVNLADFVHDSANPYGSWKWAMENMPVFQKRWKSRQVGDTRLMDDPTDWKMWKSNVVQMATRMGMSANALVDGVTCAVGARSIYKSRYKRYKEIGASDEVAHKRALQDAEIGYNLTQQSSEGAFVSSIQKDRTVAANMLSVFRNSSMAYTRQWVDAARNLRKRTQKGYREDSIKFMARQMQDQFNLDEADAKKAAEQEYAREGRRDVARMLNMMFGVTVAWNLGASLPYLLVGDDDNTKKEMLTDALLKGLMAGPVEGLAAGNIISDFVGVATDEGVRNAFRDGGLWGGFNQSMKNMGEHDVNPLPLFADMERMIGKMKSDEWAAAQELFNICMQSAVGVNPQTFTDMWNACMDYGAPAWDGTKITDDQKDFARPKEIALFIMRVLNAPTGSWRNRYIDELGMNAEDAQKLPYEEMARRYAHYKHWKDAPIMGWLRGEEGRQKKMETIRKQFDKAVDERIARLTDDELKSNLARSKSIEEKRRYAKVIHSRLGGNGKDAGNAKEEWQREYQGLMQYDDIREDEELSARKKAARGRGDSKTVKAIEKLEDRIRDKGKKMLGKGDDDSGLMGKIRQWRAEALEVALKAEPQQGGSEGGRYDKGGVFRYDDVADAPMDGYAGQMERSRK